MRKQEEWGKGRKRKKIIQWHKLIPNLTFSSISKSIIVKNGQNDMRRRYLYSEWHKKTKQIGDSRLRPRRPTNIASYLTKNARFTHPSCMPPLWGNVPSCKYLEKRDHHLDETGVALSGGDVDRQRTVLTLLVQVGSVAQQQPTEFRVTEDGRHVKRRVAGDVSAAGLRATRQQQLRHSVVGPSDGVVQGRATLVVLEVDVGIQLEQGVHRHVETSTYGHQQGRLTTSLSLSDIATSHQLLN